MIATATTPADEERAARKRERDLAKARRAAEEKRQREARESRRTNEREWKAWTAWCLESAASLGALKRAREDGDPQAIKRAKQRDIIVLRRMPRAPRGKKPRRTDA